MDKWDIMTQSIVMQWVHNEDNIWDMYCTKYLGVTENVVCTKQKKCELGKTCDHPFPGFL